MDMHELAQQLGEKLKQQRMQLSLAESCTGGGIASAVTDIAGSSAWFDRGFVTYSNAAKVAMLDVSQQALDDFGAVSSETAESMAVAALHHSDADLALSVTGIAGPGGGTDDKPVGTVWFGIAKGGVVASTCQSFAGDRMAIREQAVRFALQWLLLFVDN